MVYHSHTLEHLDRSDGEHLSRECRRVLVAGGILRVVVPDLEQTARAYLGALERAAAAPGAESFANHEWMTLELVDQLARQRSGGEIMPFLSREPLVNADFVVSRWGREGREYLAGLEASKAAPRTTRIELLKARLWNVRAYPTYLREILLMALLGRAYDTWSLGRFRKAGEAHLAMYDRLSLAQLLERCGFVDVHACEADRSSIPEWSSYGLDLDADGTVYRPNSLFMEGRAPPPPPAPPS